MTLRARFPAACAVLVFVTTAAPGCRRSDPSTAPAPDPGPETDLLPGQLYLEPNQGQVAGGGDVDFLASGPGYDLFLTSREASIALASSEPRRPRTILRLELDGAADVPGTGEGRFRGRTHYFFGRDGSQRVPAVPRFERVRFPQVYPGIDVVYYASEEQRLEYDFEVGAGSDPGAIRLAVTGSERASVAADGTLVLHTAVGLVRQPRPVAYQERAGQRYEVAVRYALSGNAVRFELGAYNRDLPLTIDPEVLYEVHRPAGVLASESALDVALGPDGTSFLATTREATNLFTGIVTIRGQVLQLSPIGTLLDSAILDFGETVTAAEGIARNPSDGLIAVAGYSGDCLFPRNGDPQCAEGEDTDGFVAVLDASLSTLSFVRHTGGAKPDAFRAVAVRSFPAFLAAGVTASGELCPGEGQNALLVLDVPTSPSPRIRCLAGSGVDEAVDVAMAGDQAFVLGRTNSADFPTSDGAHQSALGGGFDLFVHQQDIISFFGQVPSPTDYTTYLGGPTDEIPGGIAVHRAAAGGLGIATVAGARHSESAFLGTDVLAARLDEAGSKVWETAFNLATGGTDLARSVAVDDAGRVYLAGRFHPLQIERGENAAFLSVLRDNGVRRETHVFFSTDESQEFNAIALDKLDRSFTVVAAGFSGPAGDLDVYAARVRFFAARDDAYVLDEDTILSVPAPGVLGNDIAGAGDPKGAILETPPANAIQFSLAADGSFTYVPRVDFSGTDAFTYRMTDGMDLSLPVTVMLTVLAVEDHPPVATNDSYALPVSGTLSVAAELGVLANDTDGNGDELAAVLLSGPSYGTLSLHPLGGFSYVADPDFPGTGDSFIYRAKDPSQTLSGPALVTITGAARSAPDSTTTLEDTPVILDVLGNDPAFPDVDGSLTPPPEDEVVYCYDGFDAECGGSDAPATAFAAGRLTRIRDKPGEVAFGYDAAGRQVREARTLALPGDSRTLITETAFDENGSPVSVTLPTGVAIERAFDETNREVSLSVRAPGGPATPLLEVGGGAQGEGWYPYGGLRAWRSASGALRFTIEQDASSWVTRTSATSDLAPEESAETTYRYATDGNVIAIDSPLVNNVAHDSLGRITFDRGSSYTYDDAGNRLSGPGGALEYRDPSSNRWSTAEGGTLTYAFDAAGNVTQRGALALLLADDGTVIALDSAADGKIRFFRDHRNLRIASTGASGNERFVYSAAGDLELRLLDPVAEPCGAGRIREVTPVEHYVYLGGRRVAMVDGRLEGTCGTVGGGAVASVGESHFYFADKMDLARAVYRESDGRAVWRAELDAFAVSVGAGVDEDPDGDGVAFEQAFRLPGQQEIRGTELSENWNRVYDRVVGRYLQPDPASKIPMTIGQPIYAYAENSPLSTIDANGLWSTRGCDPEQARAIQGAIAIAQNTLRTCLTCKEDPPLNSWLNKIQAAKYHCKDNPDSCARAERPNPDKTFSSTGLDVTVFTGALPGPSFSPRCGCLQSVVAHEAGHLAFGGGHPTSTGVDLDAIVGRCFGCAVDPNVFP